MKLKGWMCKVAFSGVTQIEKRKVVLKLKAFVCKSQSETQGMDYKRYKMDGLGQMVILVLNI